MIKIGLLTLAIALLGLTNKHVENTTTVEKKSLDNKEVGIHFEDISFEEALKKAKATNKLIFLDAYAVWCGPCKWMDAQTFRDKEVGEFFNANFINLKKDMEKGEGPVLARRFKVTAYPTMFFIDGDGTVKHKILGAKPAKEFLKEAEKVTSN